MKKYKHLTKEQRDKLAVLRSQGKTLREIALLTDCHYSSLCRELKRNGGRSMYFPHKAQEKAVFRQHNNHKRKRLKTFALRHDIEQMLMKGWSPEQISGRLKLNHGKNIISHEAVYQWIYAEAPYLAHYLVRRHKNRFPKNYSRKNRGIRIPDRVSIKERPEAINARSQAGHWETDLVVSSKSASALQTTVERVSRYVKIGKTADKTSGESSAVLKDMLLDFPKELRRSITYDNGSKNVEHLKINNELETVSYFCEPYHSWEKGSIENANGLIRRFLPKKTDFKKVSEEQIGEIENWLNNRPRKCLGYKTSAEVFNNFVALAG